MLIKKDKRFQFSSRSERAKYIGKVYEHFLVGKVIDVGSSGSDLKKYVNGEYIGMDIINEPEIDVVINLEKEKIPFDDNYADCVVCTDVLEHLDNFHEVFEELLRITNNYIIISLPNAYNYEIVFKILLGKKIKFYGLPVDKPKDRHKWFMSHNEIANFFQKNAIKYNYSLIDLYGHPLKYKGFKGKIILFFVWFFSFGKYKQFSTMSTWALLKKN